MLAVVSALFALFLVALYIFYRLQKLMKWRRIVLFDHQRGVSYRRGVFDCLLGPGVYWESVTRTITPVDVRRQILTLPGQEILTTDGIAVKLSAVIEYSISDPVLMLTSTANFHSLLYSYSQQCLRATVSELAFESLLTSRVTIAEKTLQALAPRAASLGAFVTSSQVNDIMLPADIRRAYALAVTAQKEGLAALERARGETAALRSLANAARLMQDHPGLLQLRALQTLEASKGSPTLEIRLDDPGRPNGIRESQ